jgi:hypothetical protein
MSDSFEISKVLIKHAMHAVPFCLCKINQLINQSPNITHFYTTNDLWCDTNKGALDFMKKIQPVYRKPLPIL